MSNLTLLLNQLMVYTEIPLGRLLKNVVKVSTNPMNLQELTYEHTEEILKGECFTM